jgi:hypothetical protein
VAETWLTYREFAGALDISAEAARQKALRAGDGNGATMQGWNLCQSRTRESRSHAAHRRAAEAPDQHQDGRHSLEALESHIATLKKLSPRPRRSASSGAKKPRWQTSVSISSLLTWPTCRCGCPSQTAAKERVRAELDAYRARPLWRRLISSAG